MIEKLRSTWNILRIFRLALGGVLIYNAIMGRDIIAAVLGSLLTMQSITNTGCALGSCASTIPTKANGPAPEITFEEIKNSTH